MEDNDNELWGRASAELQLNITITAELIMSVNINMKHYTKL